MADNITNNSNYTKLSNKQQLNSDIPNTNNDSLELSQIIRNFFKVNIKEVEPTTHKNINENILEGDLSFIADELVDLIFTDFNKGKEGRVADLGNLHGICNLGVCYENGIGTDIDEEKAFKLYQAAANLGYSYGVNNLGCCYNYGIGIDFDEETAFGLYQKAANSGNEYAQYNLAIMYEHGKVVEENMEKAIYWFKKCADQGHQDAKKKLMSFQINY
ncbi:kinase-like domain-containing protein [Rhizophagus irregularis DAOM 181602=DAOM 197198]|nr:kinase-like domain-containing protein [Rhizophagus irregularis DAOM 181602=DAOM 197198]